MIEWNETRGRVDESLPEVKQKLNGYLRNYDCIKIGATSAPDVRWNRQHQHDGWVKHVVLYEYWKAGQARSMEKKLIEYARYTNFRVKPDNVLPGGESINDGYEKYWVYVLLA